MSDPLDGLDGAERLACRVAEHVLGVTARAWDTGGRQGVVDAFLDYPDGRLAAFEVTRLAANPGALQLDQLLGRDGFEWPLPGQWWWDVWVGSPRDLPRLRESFRKIVLMCEQAGATRPEQLRWRRDVEVDPDLRWLLEESTSSLWGHPGVPAVDGERIRRAMVTPDGGGGAVDEELTGLCAALTTALSAGHVQRRVAKLNRTPADERHLFVIVHMSDLSDGVIMGLSFGDALPPGQPPLPAGVTHLWLAPQFSQRVVLGTVEGWTHAHPYDN